MGISNFFKKKEKVVEKPVIAEESKVIEKQKKSKTLKTTNSLVSKCYVAIEKEVAKDYYDEAKQIIDLSSDEIRNEFLKYHQEGNNNVCCMVLDKAKRDLIANGKLEYNSEGAFGHPFMM